MKAAYVTLYDASDVNIWSGLGSYIGRSVSRQGVHLDYIGPLRWNGLYRYRAKKLWCEGVRGKHHLREREPRLAHHFARQVAQRLKNSRPDIVFSPGTIPIAQLDCTQPIVIWADATFAGLL